MPAFTCQKRVRFHHCDPAGIVFFVQYFSIVNEVNEDWWNGPLDVDWRVFHIDQKMGMPIKKTSAEFFAPSYLSDILDCSLSIDRLGASSLPLTIKLTCKGELRAIFYHVIVQISSNPVKAVPFSDELRAKLERFVVPREAR
ncbi:MAG: thioesterase family protein [Burkholderiales bacterium]